MGTPGLVGFKIDGNLLLSYTHWDAYPDSLGADTLAFARKVADWDAVREVVRGLTQVDEQEVPSEEELAVYNATTGGQFANRGVSTGDDWYALLRETQGDLAKVLASGYIASIGREKSYAQYSYVLDLDANTFTSYDGSVDGSILSVYSLDALPETDTYLTDNGEDEDDE
jgi:hypothetical protein